jgi:integrase
MDEMPEHLQRRGGRYWFRRKVPADLRAHYGYSELVRNLGTGDRTEAARRCREVSVEIDREFARVRSEMAQANRALSPDEIRHLSDLYLARRLREDDTIRVEGLSEEQYKQSVEQLEQDLRDAREALARGDFGFVQPLLEDFLTERGLVLSDSSPSWRALAFAIAKADIQAQELLQRRDRGEVVETPAVASLVPAGTPYTLDALFDYWATRAQPTERSLLEARSSLKRFKEVNGDVRAPKVRKAHITALRDALVERGLARSTIEKALSLIRAMFQTAADDDAMGITSNPCAGVKVRAGKDSKLRPQWTVGALNALFSSPVYTERFRPEGGKGEAAYFVPLLCLYSGSRLGEVTGLRVDDVREADGITFLDFTRRKLKTASSLRRVPVHPMLVDLGLLRYVAHQRETGHAALFPGCTPESFQKWFGRYLDSIGVMEPTSHSFRHLIKSQFRLLGFPEDIGDALVGHVNGSIGRAYGSAAGFPLAPLADWMRRLRFENLKLPPPWEPAAPSRSHRAKPSSR